MPDPLTQPREFGFVRVAACSPRLRVADTRYNGERTLDLLRQAADQGVDLAVFPELGLTSYTCHDLFHQSTLIDAAEEALGFVLKSAADIYDGVFVVGLPVRIDGRLFNAGAVACRGRLLGVVPKSYLPNYKEFYDARYFAPAACAVSDSVKLCNQTAPFGTDLLFAATDESRLTFGIEICEDLWTPVPPSSLQALAGATVVANLSASPSAIGKASYRRQLVASQSAKCLAGYVYAACGPGESTTDLVFDGHCLVAENGVILGETPRFRLDGALTIADLDLDRLTRDRTMTTTFLENARQPGLSRPFRRVALTLGSHSNKTPPLMRPVDAHPFVPTDPETLQERCSEIFHTQVTGLARRLTHVGVTSPSIGVSGGMDSTLALIVLCKTLDAIGAPRSKVNALTMPGFGTTGRTLKNARSLMATLGVGHREVDIRAMCLDQMKALGHAPFGIALDGLGVEQLTSAFRDLTPEAMSDLVFENVQARVRTGLLMNAGFVVGTGDLSELALGWCTYNADHMSMYNPNVSIPKTLVKFLVRWAAENEFGGEARKTLLDIVSTEISPELLPAKDDGTSPQSTEGTIGPYELHDFFIYHFLRHGASPDKILFLASQAQFDREYSLDDITKWLTVFLTRFFASQFKRSCLPDGPKVGSISLSPRGDWRMPSDAVARNWLERLS